jgi:arylsulfatase A-like enzyme
VRRALLALLVVAAAAAALGCGRPSAPPHVVLVVLDTTRADHLSAYGYERPTTPHLDAFAERSILFEQAFATSSWTVPSHASLFTGLLAITHQATQEREYLADEFETLAELLSEAGYETIAFSNNAWVSPRTNLVQGFDHVGEMWRQRGVGQAGRTNEAIRGWLEVRNASRPFFLFVNYIEPHWTYTAPRAFQDRFIAPRIPAAERKRANFGVVDWYLERNAVADRLLPVRIGLYDAEVAYADAALGGLLGMLPEFGVDEGSLIIVLSDHGENLGDNGHQGHSFALYDSTLRIPLLIRSLDGSGAGTRRSDPVQLTDVFATIARTTGLHPADRRVAGRDLLAGPLPGDRPILGEYYYPVQFLSYFPEEVRQGKSLASYRRRIRSLRVGTHKLIWGSDGRHELYDVERDPGETRNLWADEPELAGELEGQLEQLLERHRGETPPVRPEAPPLDPATEENLRELGYLR